MREWTKVPFCQLAAAVAFSTVFPASLNPTNAAFSICNIPFRASLGPDRNGIVEQNAKETLQSVFSACWRCVHIPAGQQNMT